jgi:excisionase family DNA binding protein
MERSRDLQQSAPAGTEAVATNGTLMHPSSRRAASSLTLTIPQAAMLLGISVSAAYEFARKGELPTFKLGTRVLVSRKRLEELIDGYERVDPAPA